METSTLFSRRRNALLLRVTPILVEGIVADSPVHHISNIPPSLHGKSRAATCKQVIALLEEASGLTEEIELALYDGKDVTTILKLLLSDLKDPLPSRCLLPSGNDR
jgi:hypothetical protein